MLLIWCTYVILTFIMPFYSWVCLIMHHFFIACIMNLNLFDFFAFERSNSHNLCEFYECMDMGTRVGKHGYS